MSKTVFLFFFLISFLNASNIQISLEDQNEDFNEYIFLESMNDSSSNNYKHLKKSKNNILINLNANFNNYLGLNYKKVLTGITYDLKEIYVGTPSMKYFSYSKENKDIKYNNLKTKKDITNYTLFNIIDISKEKFSSSSKELVPDEKEDLFQINSLNKTVYRNFTLEKFALTSEHLYDMAKEDANNNNTYLYPGVFSKKINSNLKIYGVGILAYVQKNYTNISNYIVDSNGTKQNISYKNNENSTTNNLELTSDIDSDFYLIGRYRGFEYGYKITLQYDIKKYYSMFLTSYYKATNLKNKYTKNNNGNYKTTKGNALAYDSIKYTKKYINFGFRYKF